MVDTRDAAFRDQVPSDVEFIDLGCRRVRQALPKLVRLLWRRRPDVVMSTLGHLNLALAIVRRRDLHLTILGDGPLRAELGARAEACGIAEHVHFAGFQRNPYPTLAAADLLVLSSRYEGFPNCCSRRWPAAPRWWLRPRPAACARSSTASPDASWPTLWTAGSRQAWRQTPWRLTPWSASSRLMKRSSCAMHRSVNRIPHPCALPISNLPPSGAAQREW